MDEIDRQILDLLQRDGKISQARIAEAVGLTTPSVNERIKKLETRGFIRRFTALLDPRLTASATLQTVYGPSRAYFDAPNGNSTTLDRLLYADLKTYLVGLLMKQDQMSMAASIESRVPFLDHHLVEFAAALRPRLKLRGFTTKWILREAVKRILPPAILTRKKMGFPVPFALWMRGSWSEMARDVLLDKRTRERGLIHPAAVGQLLDAHVAGAAEGGDALWSLLNLELWYRTFIDGAGIQVLGAPDGAPLPDTVAPVYQQPAGVVA